MMFMHSTTFTSKIKAEPKLDKRSDNAFSKLCVSCQQCCKKNNMLLFYKQLAPEKFHKEIEKKKQCAYLEDKGCKIFKERQTEKSFLGCSLYPFYPKWNGKGKMEIEINKECPAKNFGINLKGTSSYIAAYNEYSSLSIYSAPKWILEMETEKIKDSKKKILKK